MLPASLPDNLTLEQKQRAEEFIHARANVFSRSEFDIGRTNIIPHRIETGDNSLHFEQLHQLRHHGARKSLWYASRMEPCVCVSIIAS